jgi:hypothetical protein
MIETSLIVSSEQVRIVKEEVSYFKVIWSGIHLGKAEKNHDKP